MRHLELADRHWERAFGADYHNRVKTLIPLASESAKAGDLDRAIELAREATRIGRDWPDHPEFVLRPTVRLAKYLLSAERCKEAEIELLTSPRSGGPYRPSHLACQLGSDRASTELGLPGGGAEAQRLLEAALQALSSQPESREYQRTAALLDDLRSSSIEPRGRR